MDEAAALDLGSCFVPLVFVTLDAASNRVTDTVNNSTRDLHLHIFAGTGATPQRLLKQKPSSTIWSGLGAVIRARMPLQAETQYSTV